ncbi:hypothetical protein ABN028_06395 [Actinopolymorpha sp. B17G11]|uniref:hypothetical protein n=1 Tax=unclassified Actinopolymorpha TaxID=2627063 RepID=UPI0032D99204
MIIAFLALVTSVTGGGAMAEQAAAAGGDKRPVVQAETAAIHLDSKQAKALEHAWKSNPALTVDEALAVIGEEELAIAPRRELARADERNVGTTEEGEDEVTRECSTMSLWGDSDGNWTWTNEFFRRKAGPALAGAAQVSTNGELSVASNFTFEGLEQREGDQVPFTGFFSTATQVTAFSWNQPLSGGPIVCYGWLTVWWE